MSQLIKGLIIGLIVGSVITGVVMASFNDITPQDLKEIQEEEKRIRIIESCDTS